MEPQLVAMNHSIPTTQQHLTINPHHNNNLNSNSDKKTGGHDNDLPKGSPVLVS
jgi:hypothetical protein